MIGLGFYEYYREPTMKMRYETKKEKHWQNGVGYRYWEILALENGVSMVILMHLSVGTWNSDF
jgi:hypothetical protein